MERLGGFVLRHRRMVVMGWLLLMLVGVFAAGQTSKRLSLDFSLPGQPGYETEKQILATYGNGGSNQPSIVVVTVPQGTTVDAQQAQITSVMDKLQAAAPQARMVDYATMHDPVFVTQDGRSTYALAFPPKFTSFDQKLPTVAMRPVLEQAKTDTGFDWGVTGYNELSQNGSDNNGPSLLAETLLGGLGAMAVLVFLFASFLAFIPLVIAVVSILNTFTIVLLGTYVFNISFVVQFLIALVGLGVAVDYSLLLVNRWREERAHGRENHEAVLISMKYAGHAVLASAGTVAISLCSLLVIPVPLLRSMGIGGMLIPLVSTLVVLTLLPAILGGIGPRVDWPRIRNESKASRAWTGWARFIVRFKWPAAAAATAMLAVLMLPIFGIKIGQTQTDSLATSGPSYTQLHTLREGGVPAGVVSPMEVLIKGGDLNAETQQVITAAKAVPGVATAFAPDNDAWQKDGMALVEVIPTNETVNSSQAHVASAVHDAVADVPGVVGVAGIGPTITDYINAVYKNFPYSLGIIALVTFLLLVRTFRSILLPIKAVLLNVISVCATFGATVWFWQDGHGSQQLFGIPATGAVSFWVPMIIFAFLFGLSMDYEVFILARMREEYDRTGSTETAVVQGIGRTGRLVTSAALILFLAFTSMASGPDTSVKMFATGLAAGILIDATIIRALIVPAVISLMGRWNWWLPTWPARLLRVEPSLPRRVATGEAEG